MNINYNLIYRMGISKNRKVISTKTKPNEEMVKIMLSYKPHQSIVGHHSENILINSTFGIY